MTLETGTTTFRIEFDRIGARRAVLPLLATVDAAAPHLLAKHLEDAILRYARPKLGSRGVEVTLDAAATDPFQAPDAVALDGSGGGLSVGWGRPGGTFHVRIDRPNHPPYIHRALPKQPREVMLISTCGLAVTPRQATGSAAKITCPRCAETTADTIDATDGTSA